VWGLLNLSVLTVNDTLVQKHLRALLADLPPGRNATDGRLAAKLGELLERVLENVSLLLRVHRRGVLVRVAVQSAVIVSAKLVGSEHRCSLTSHAQHPGPPPSARGTCRDCVRG
jgi:hypothetical protein